jgi:hypothetical protein
MTVRNLPSVRFSWGDKNFPSVRFSFHIGGSHVVAVRKVPSGRFSRCDCEEGSFWEVLTV